MFRRSKTNTQEQTLPSLTPLDRLVIHDTGDTGLPGPFEFIVRAATVEEALSRDEAWPPEKISNVVTMYSDYLKRYDRGELDNITAQLDINNVVTEAGRLSCMSPDGLLPSRRPWDSVSR